MTSEEAPRKTRYGRSWWFGVGAGVSLTVLLVLASGFMVETTNTDTFCAGCHAMTPFRSSWREAVHGGRNPKGVAAQCVDCHLPHGDLLEYVTAKAVTGIGDVVQNLVLDVHKIDWMAQAERNRTVFTYDSACRSCHLELTPPGMPRGGFIAHRAYLRGDAGKMCVECHNHVGHHEMKRYVDAYFTKRL